MLCSVTVPSTYGQACFFWTLQLDDALAVPVGFDGHFFTTNGFGFFFKTGKRGIWDGCFLPSSIVVSPGKIICVDFSRIRFSWFTSPSESVTERLPFCILMASAMQRSKSSASSSSQLKYRLKVFKNNILEKN